MTHKHPNLDAPDAEFAGLLNPLKNRFSSVELLSLSGRLHDREAFQRGLARLRAVMPVSGEERVEAGFQRFAADDETRLMWARSMAHPTDLDPALPPLLLGVRGGYGIGRLLDGIVFADLLDQLHQTRAVLCAHSDFTALQLALLAHALRLGKPVPKVLQGPMLCADFGLESPQRFTAQSFVDACAGTQTVRQPGLTRIGEGGLAPVALRGMLWGGNLTMLVSLLGTPHWPEIDGGILFFEDVNEHPYRIERLLLQLAQAGVIKRQQAVIVGACSDWKPSPLDNGYDLSAALTFIAQRTGVPVFTGLRFGHIPEKCSLPLGQSALIEVAADGSATLCFEPI